ncbi:MAG: insulinase family protein [Rhizobiales bacterium]|nr:insulinase family protein [Hyphomicrobiales bacterium]
MCALVFRFSGRQNLRLIRRISILVLAAVFAVIIAGAAPLGAFEDSDVVRLPVTGFTLDNKLEVVVIEDHRSPVVTHMVWYRVGAADEPPGKSGIAHFLEHLMFKGTDTLGPGEFSEQVALNGGTDNAFTSQDYTAYHQRIAKDRLPILMRLEADRMANLKLLEKDVETEREVILEERARRYGNSPSAQLSEQMDAALYLNHPYMRPVIGWEHEMKQLTREDAVSFYRRYYTPANAVVVIAGDVTPDEIRDLAQQTYGALENGVEIGPRRRATEPPQRAARRVAMEHTQVNLERWRRTYLAPAFSSAAPEVRAGLELLGQILGSGSSSRLYRELVIDRKVAVSAGAYYAGRGLVYGEFAFHAVPADGVSLDQLEAEIDRVIDDVMSDGVTDEELKRAKTQLIADLVFDQDSQSRMARTFGAALVTGSTVDDVINWPGDVRAVSADEIAALARDHLLLEQSVTGTLKRKAEAQEAG